MTLLQQDIERYYELKGNPSRKGLWVIAFSLLNPRLLPVTLFRLSCFFQDNHLSIIAKVCSFLNLIFFGIETSPKVQIGGGLFLPHTVGTILGAEKIGNNVTIMHGVTLGAREMDFNFTSLSRPIIGNNVFIGAGAKILGGVAIGDYARIGANAVVLKDVPSHSLAVGIPAKILEISHHNC
jgi:serine O-acetyltransferase